MVEIMLEIYVGQGVGWTVSRGAHRFHTNTPSGHPSTLLNLTTTHMLVVILKEWGKGRGAIRVIPMSGGSTVKCLNVVGYYYHNNIIYLPDSES